AAPHRKQPADVKVLAGLRLDPFISGDHEQDDVDSTDSSEHVAHEALMTGYVDKAKTQPFAIGRGKLKMRKPDINGDAASLFLFQAVGIDTGKRLDQRSLSMVDVSGRANNDGLHAINDIAGRASEERHQNVDGQ